jgi:ribose 5-phosphate isomerase B
VIVRIGLGSDRIGLECKERLKAMFALQGHSAEDVCPANFSGGEDYQSITDQVSSAVYTGRVERGVLICSRAIGASVLANKHPGVRAALCHDLHSARQGVQDDGVNLLVIGAGGVTLDFARELADAFVQASYLPCEQEFGMPPRRLARVVEYIRNHLDQPLAVSALCSLAEMSQSHFSKLFKRSTGLAPHQFVLQERINRSKAASASRQQEDCRDRAWSGLRESGALHNGVWELCGHDAAPISAFLWSGNWWDVPSSAGGRGRTQLVGMVRKSFDWIEQVQAKVVAGVENETQKLERTRDRNKCKVGA